MKKHLLFILTAVFLTSCRSAQPDGSSPSDSTVSEISDTQQTAAANSTVTVPTQTETADSGSETTAGFDIQSQLDWGQKSPVLREVQSLLDRNQIIYQGTYNHSMERVNLTLEDGTALMFLKTTDEQGADGVYTLIMIDDRFNDNAFQESYLNQYDVTNEEEYYPLTAKQLLVPEELWKYNQTDLSIARNEIFARHGRIFEDTFLNAVFSRKTWYTPLYNKDEFAKVQNKLLNSYEKENLKQLIAMEQEQGFRKEDGANYEWPASLLDGSWLDLDGNGSKERVTYKTTTNPSSSTESYEITVNGQVVTGEGENLYPTLHLASLDGEGIQLLARQSGPAADPLCNVYTYQNGTLFLSGSIPGFDIRILSDRIYSTVKFDHFQSFQGRLQFEFQDSSITEIPSDFYEQGSKAVALAEIPLYTEKGGSQIGMTLSRGDQVIILGSDWNEWVCIKNASTGEQGWLRCGGPETPYLCTLPDGTTAESYELFDGLHFYG